MKLIHPSTRPAESRGGRSHGRAASSGVRIASPASVQINLNVSAVEEQAAPSVVGTSTMQGVTSTHPGQVPSVSFDPAKVRTLHTSSRLLSEHDCYSRPLPCTKGSTRLFGTPLASHRIVRMVGLSGSSRCPTTALLTPPIFQLVQGYARAIFTTIVQERRLSCGYGWRI